LQYSSLVFLLNSQTVTENYIKTTSFLIETSDGNVTDDQKIESITYYDGLNKPKQGISLRAGGNREDLITPIIYDQFGRKVKNYLPLTVIDNGANYYTGNIESQLKTFYSNKFPDDFNSANSNWDWDNPYFENLYDDSPLNKVKEVSSPGFDWRLGNGGIHTKKFDYGTNADTEVKKFKVIYNASNDNEQILTSEGYYDPGVLFKSVNKDENWISGLLNTSESFTDKNGKTILTNSYIQQNSQIVKLSTYFVYDDLGRLIYKLTPQLVSNGDLIDYDYYVQGWGVNDFFEPGTNLSGTVRFTISNNLINMFQVGIFDPNVQGVLKIQTVKSLNTFPILPNLHLGPVMGITSNNSSIQVGIAKIENGNLIIDRTSNQLINFLEFNFTVDLSLVLSEGDLSNYAFEYRYDEYNRLIKQKTPGKGWEYMVYDKFDRPILSQDANLKNQNKWLYTKYDVFGRIVYTGIFSSSSTREALQTLANAQNTIFENRVASSTTINGSTLHYSNQVFPNSNIDVHTVNYYDTYVDHAGLSLPTTTFGVNMTLRTQGLPTVSKVRVLDTNHWITTLSTYDDKAREIYIDSKNDHLNSRVITRLKLDYTGKIEDTHSSHLKTGKPTITIRDYFHYDHSGRLKSQKQKIDNEPVQLISENFYDELGQLHRKDVGGETVLDGYTDIVNMDVTFDGTITHASNDWYWPSKLKTKGAIVDDGGISFKLIGINNHVRVGLLKPQNSNAANEYLDYGFYLQYITATDTYRVNIINNGNLQSTSYTYSPGNIFKVEREGNQVKYFRNGSIIATVVYVGNNESLTSKVAFSGPGGSIDNVVLYGPNINKKLQNISYKYNVRGWLVSMNDLSENVWRNPPLFSYAINYNKAIQGNAGGQGMAKPLFNGNISQVIWKSENTDKQKRSYAYKYDGLNRLNAAFSRKGSDLNTEDFHSLEDVNYDLNGNITSLIRFGFHQGVNFPVPWDQLLYNYEGNQLTSVSDLSNDEEGFNGKPVPGSPLTTAQYTYDANGNLKSDTGKNIVNISYNHLNLPVSVTILDGNNEGGYITYVYVATGVKLSKTFTPTGVNPNGIVTQYDGNFIYEKSVTGEVTLQFFSHPEGYVSPIADGNDSIKGFDIGTGTTTYSSYNYVFQYKDHLGNVRLSYSDLDLNGSIDPNTEIIEENHYYPFGLKHKGYNTAITGAGNVIAQQYKFGGKQLQEELGLQWYDFGSRNYDAAIGRWFNTDPLNQFDSPYLYAFNNPVISVDPDGEFAFIIAGIYLGMMQGMIQNQMKGNSFHGNWANIGLSAAKGGVTGAIGGVNAVVGSAYDTFTFGYGTINVSAGSNLSFNLSPAFAFGSYSSGFGANLGFNYQSGNFNLSGGVGIMSYSSYNGLGVNGTEFRNSLMAGFDDGKTGFSLDTNFWNGKDGMSGFNQQTGLIKGRIGDFNVSYENDGAPFGPGEDGKKGTPLLNILGDGEDSHRSAHLSIGVGDYRLGANIFTGKREYVRNENPENPVSPLKRMVGMFKPQGEPGGYGATLPYGLVNEKGTQHRFASLYFGWNNMRIGAESYRHIGHPIQNIFAHYFLSPQPGFETTSNNLFRYFQYQTRNPFTSW